MVLGTACSNLLSTFDLVRKCQLIVLMKAQITRKWIKLFRPLYVHYARAVLQFKSNNDNLGIKSVKSLLVL